MLLTICLPYCETVLFIPTSELLSVHFLTFSHFLSIHSYFVDGGFNTSVTKGGVMVNTPGYPGKLNDSYTASWVLSVDRNDSKGILQQVNAKVTFTPNNSTK